MRAFLLLAALCCVSAEQFETIQVTASTVQMRCGACVQEFTSQNSTLLRFCALVCRAASTFPHAAVSQPVENPHARSFTSGDEKVCEAGLSSCPARNSLPSSPCQCVYCFVRGAHAAATHHTLSSRLLCPPVAGLDVTQVISSPLATQPDTLLGIVRKVYMGREVWFADL